MYKFLNNINFKKKWMKNLSRNIVLYLINYLKLLIEFMIKLYLYFNCVCVNYILIIFCKFFVVILKNWLKVNKIKSIIL